MRLALLRLIMVAVIAVVLLPRSAHNGLAQQPDFDIAGGHFFTQTGGGTGKGFAVTDDNQGRLWAEFQRLGGVQALGYPASQRFLWQGFVTQAFQRVILQWRPDLGQAFFVNVFDLLHDAGRDDYLLVVRQVPRQAQFDDTGLSFSQIVANRLALLDADPAIRAKYFSVVGDPVAMNGLPTSPVTDMGNHFALRAQRVVFQHWKSDVPWAAAGEVTVALGGDIAKEVGLLPDEAALQPVNAPTPSSGLVPKVEVVASNLEVPWSLAFAPDGRLFFTERPGRVRVIVNGQLQSNPVAELPAASGGEVGLMGLALDPDFATNHHLYVMYTYRSPAGGLLNRVSRLTESNNLATDERVLLDNIPGASIHDGGRLKFGPDRALYITTGDAANQSLPQEAGSVAGKILRLNADGSIPSDNPFPNSPIYSLGHRNPQGLAWHPATGLLYSTEHGPVGNDEVNIIQAGQNYGWPVVSGIAGVSPFVDPILAFSPSVAPAGAAFYTGDQLSAWRGNLFFATLTGRHLDRVVLGGPEFRNVESQERLFENDFGRLRDVVTGPDGFLYFTTSNRDGRGNPVAEDDRILRIVPGP